MGFLLSGQTGFSEGSTVVILNGHPSGRVASKRVLIEMVSGQPDEPPSYLIRPISLPPLIVTVIPENPFKDLGTKNLRKDFTSNPCPSGQAQTQ